MLHQDQPMNELFVDSLMYVFILDSNRVQQQYVYLNYKSI